MTQKNRHLRTIAQLCRAISSQLRHVSTIGKTYLFHTSLQYCELRPTNGWDRFSSLGHPRKFQRASSLQRRRSPEANQTLHDAWPSPGLVHYIFIFGGSCPLTEFCQVQNLLEVQVLRSAILAASLHGTPGAGVSKTLRHRTKNGITELSQRAPYTPCLKKRPTFGLL